MQYLLVILLAACPSKEEAAARNCHQYPYELSCPCRDYVGFVCRVDQRLVSIPLNGGRDSTDFYCKCDREVTP